MIGARGEDPPEAMMTPQRTNKRTMGIIHHNFLRQRNWNNSPKIPMRFFMLALLRE
jgi:hypothetical protein